MPNRIIKESICTSENIDQLTPFEETVFVRLMVKCDDFGRFDGRPKVLSSMLFPLKDITREQMQDALDSLVAADLVEIRQGYGKPVVCMKTWSNHQRTRASETKFPLMDDWRGQMSATCGQMSADVSDPKTSAENCGFNRKRKRNTETIFDNRKSETESLIDDEDAHRFQAEQNRVLDAADDAGFPKSNSVRAGLIRLYADYGLDRVLKGIESCVRHSAQNLAYLEACLKDKPRKQKDQGFEQRDYSQVPSEQMDELAAEMAAFKKGAV